MGDLEIQCRRCGHNSFYFIGYNEDTNLIKKEDDEVLIYECKACKIRNRITISPNEKK